MLRKCRDCGADSDEAPDDPVPALCPPCYKARLDHITPEFARMCEATDGEPVLMGMWLRRALIEVAGEAPTFAAKHAAKIIEAALK